MQHGAVPRLTTAASWSGVGVGVGVGGGLPSQSVRCETAGTACAPGRTQRGEPRWDFTTHVPEKYVSLFLGKDPASQALRTERARLQHQIFGSVSSSATDSNGWPKGVGAGLPNSRDAGTLKKDFVLARYGEHAVTQTATASASAPKFARGNVFSPRVGAVGSSDPVPPGASRAPKDSPQRDLQGGLTFHEARAAAQYWTAAEWLSQRAASAVARGEASTENQHQPADPHLTESPRAQPNSTQRTPLQPRVGSGIPYAAQDEPSTPRTPRTEMLTPRTSTAVHAPSGTGRIAMSPFPASRPGSSQTNRSGTAPSRGGRRDPEPRKAPEGSISPALPHGPSHSTTCLHQKPLSKWKGLKTPGFYLTSLPKGSTGSVPSKFFQKTPSMMVSTDGHQLVSAFVNKPLPNDAQHLSASKEYFAPKGLGSFRCSICDRSFLNHKLLEQHCKRQVVRVRLKSLLANDFVVLTVFSEHSTSHVYNEAMMHGFVKEAHPIPKSFNILDCGEFDDAYYELCTESDFDEGTDRHGSEEETSVPASPGARQLERKALVCEICCVKCR